MLKYSNFAIVVSFFGLWLVSFISDKAQIILGFILILTFGILHGANDILLIKNINSTKKEITFFKLLLYYVLVVGIGALMFCTIPWLALLFFILISGYHFGEQQWQNMEKSFLFRMFEFVYGILILTLLFIFHIKEVQEVILDITSVLVPEKIFYYALTFSFLLTFLLGVNYSLKIKQFKRKCFKEAFYLLVFTVIFKTASLIWGFAIYFIIWHSIPSIINQVTYLNGKFNVKNFSNYVKTASLYWLVSLFGIALLYFLFKDIKIFNALFFSFLAAITFPHVLVIFLVLKER